MVTSLRRVLALVATTVLLAVVGVLASVPALACACGAMLSDEESHVRVQQEFAAIGWDGQTERLVMSLAAISDTDDAALLLPTPSPATVSLAEEGLFGELDEIIAPRVRTEYYWWPGAMGDGAGAPEGGTGGSVEVLETVDLGPVEATVLGASDPDELAQWLDQHGYVMGDALAAAVAPYVTEGWFYVAVRLTAEGALSGSLPPLDITFESPTVVYPMRMSAAAATPQYVRTYVFADQRMARSDATWSSGHNELRYAGRPDASAVQNATLAELLEVGPYLTVHDQSYYRPGSEIVSDFIFDRSSNGGDYHEEEVRYRLRTFLGIAAGPFVLVAGIVVVLAAAVVTGLLLQRRERSRSGA